MMIQIIFVVNIVHVLVVLLASQKMKFSFILGGWQIDFCIAFSAFVRPWEKSNSRCYTLFARVGELLTRGKEEDLSCVWPKAWVGRRTRARTDSRLIQVREPATCGDAACRRRWRIGISVTCARQGIRDRRGLVPTAKTSGRQAGGRRRAWAHCHPRRPRARALARASAPVWPYPCAPRRFRKKWSTSLALFGWDLGPAAAWRVQPRAQELAVTCGRQHATSVGFPAGNNSSAPPKFR
jgi:hypothetical protein